MRINEVILKPPLQGRGWGGVCRMKATSRWSAISQPAATRQQAAKSHCPSPKEEGGKLIHRHCGRLRRLMIAQHLAVDFARRIFRQFIDEFDDPREFVLGQPFAREGL